MSKPIMKNIITPAKTVQTNLTKFYGDCASKQYIRNIADRRLIGLGMKGIFKVKRNPLPWVEEMINAPTHTNFFENRSTDYSKGALSGTWDDVWGKAA